MYMQIAEITEQLSYLFLAVAGVLLIYLIVSILAKEIKMEEKQRNYRSYRNSDMNKGRF